MSCQGVGCVSQPCMVYRSLVLRGPYEHLRTRWRPVDRRSPDRRRAVTDHPSAALSAGSGQPPSSPDLQGGTTYVVER